MKEIYDFLKSLDANNNREWFDLNRDTYQKTRQQFLYITEVLINEIRTFDPEIDFLDPKKCVFRIFRDVRFSHDKRPYKVNFGCFISRDGRKGGSPGYYFHVQPGHSFLGGGVFQPTPDRLRAIRKNIFNDPTDFIELLEEPEFKSRFQLYGDDKLKTVPKGFPRDFEHIDLLRYKSYAPVMKIDDDLLLDPDIVELILSHFKLLTPFNHFLNRVNDHLEL